MLLRFILAGSMAVWFGGLSLHGQLIDPTDPERTVTGFLYEPPYAFAPGGGLALEARTAIDKNATETNVLYRDPSSNDYTGIKEDITHQPLIHIKARVVEVDRSDSLSVASVLDYFSHQGAATSLTDGSPLNGPNRERLGGATRFSIPELISSTSNGSGALVNLTGEHLNWVASMLATELNSDIINAPQVTTLNGKNVTFRAGSKVAFDLGANVFQANGNTTTNTVFYKHVGLYLSVTPQIVHWGELHEGRGQVRDDYATEKDLARLPLGPEDIVDLEACLLHLRNNDELRGHVRELDPEFYEALITAGIPALAAAGDTLTAVVQILNGVLADSDADRFTLAQTLDHAIGVPRSPTCADCDWRAADCTINLNIAVRLSDAGSFRDDGTFTAKSEDDVRAISNVVQVKSGHGVVMGGLISMRDVQAASKIPVLGDLPLVGAAFRAKRTQRRKTETIIMVEASVLPPLDLPENCGLETARSITSQDYCNGKIHLEGDLCHGFLADGMCRAGLAAHYLPPLRHDEKQYWLDYQRQVKHRKISTQLFDTFKQ